MKINVKFISENKEKTIKGLKILSEEKLRHVRGVTIKEGCILYPAKLFKKSDQSVSFVSKDGKIVKERAKASFVIETKDDMSEYEKVKVFSLDDKKKKDEIIEIKAPTICVEDKEVVDNIVVKKIEEKRVSPIVEAQEQQAQKIEQSASPHGGTATSDEQIDTALLSVLENIKEKTIIKEEKQKADNEVEKLRLELMRKKLELISQWLEANKEEVK